MKADRFFTVEIVDKCSRMFMLLFAGIVLGTVLALFFYNVLCPKIDATLVLIAAYCVAFSTYIAIANARRKITKIDIFKDKLAFIFSQKSAISRVTELNYSDIKSYTVSPLTPKKNQLREVPNPNEFNLRAFGFKTVVETHSGEKLEFQDSYSDGVLIYSPSYIYRLIDIKRYRPEFPLNLINFDSKKDVEDFKYQFEYYRDNEKNLTLCKNKKYIKCLLKYTAVFALIAILLASGIGYVISTGLNRTDDAFLLLTVTFGILLIVMLSMWLTSYVSSIMGNCFNKRTRNIIKQILTEE